MKHSLLLAAFFFLAPHSGEAAQPQLAHMVFFTLAEDTPENQEKLVAACNKYLTGHDGTVYYSAGTIAEELDRDVNDRKFDVSLHLVFASKAAHDKYQTHRRHLQFIKENEHLWSGVRVFDSHVAPSVTGLPKGAAGFAGLLRGKVVSRDGSHIVFSVGEVAKVWRTNKAENPQALVGRNVTVDGSQYDLIARFMKSLEAGDKVSLDVANKAGSTLAVLELTADQREQVKE